MSNIFENRQTDRRWLAVLPLFAIAAILILEVETPSLRVTPSLLTIILASLALLLPPRMVFYWAAVLFIPFVLTLALVPNNGIRETPAFVALRSAAYVAGAWVAVGLSRHRWDSERRLEVLLTLFEALKTPILVSDVDGNINFANRACGELLGRSTEELKAMSFFSVFSQPDQRGQSIERYLTFFDKDPGLNSSIALNVQRESGETVRSAVVFTMAWDKLRFLVTQLS